MLYLEVGGRTVFFDHKGHNDFSLFSAFLCLFGIVKLFLDELQQGLITAREFRHDFAFVVYFFFVLFNSPDKPDAIVCINDEVAIGVIRYLKEQGVSIPAEVAVAGFDDNPMGLVCDPELTTLSPSINLLSESMLNLLLREIESGENIKEDIVLPLQLLERGSA